MSLEKTDALHRFAYRKSPLHERYPDLADVPEAFLLDWFKDRYDYPRLHTREEIQTMMSLPPEAVLTWLEEAVELTWTAKRQQWEQRRRSR
jgi:hypothetical protein